MSTQQPKKGKFLERLADDNGVAVVVLDENGREHASANNNSICASLYSSPEFSPKCVEFCGKAFEKTLDGSTCNYECHAGLTCRAVQVEDGGKRFVAIVGRTFLKA
ncbi:MAG: PocR ligand-binding domain-containing protein, partial [Blastocatellia bacterium]